MRIPPCLPAKILRHFQQFILRRLLSIADGKPVDPPSSIKQNGKPLEGAGHIADSGKRSWKSPDGKWQVHVRDGAVVLADNEGKERQLAKAPKQHRFESEPHWSPDGKAFTLWLRPLKKNSASYLRSLQPQRSTPTRNIHQQLSETW